MSDNSLVTGKKTDSWNFSKWPSRRGGELEFSRWNHLCGSVGPANTKLGGHWPGIVESVLIRWQVPSFSSFYQRGAADQWLTMSIRRRWRCKCGDPNFIQKRAFGVFKGKGHSYKFLRIEGLISSSFDTQIHCFALIYRDIALLLLPRRRNRRHRKIGQKATP